MARAMRSRTTKRKHTRSSQEIITENSKENLPTIKNQNKAKNIKANNEKQAKIQSSVLTSKENIVASNSFQNSNSFLNNDCILRKSERNRKSSYNIKDYVYNIPKGETNLDNSAKRNVLSDKTNSPLTVGSKTSLHSQVLQATQNKNNDLIQRRKNCQLNESCSAKGNTKPHIPVYKAVDSSDGLGTTCNLPPEKKEAIYVFDEVDENEPVKKRKNKRRAYKRKPKIGPKALTINNIKFSSTESLVSLSDKPLRKKKTKPKVVVPCIKPYSSVSNLNDSNDTCYTVNSFLSHPPSLMLSNHTEPKNQRELSVLQETQSEFCQSPVCTNSSSLNNAQNLPELMVGHPNSNSLNVSSVLPNNSHIYQNDSAFPQHRCYSSKRSNLELNTQGISQNGSVDDALPNQLSHSSEHFSTASSHDFLSSTPCKKTSLVVCRNSVFSDSYDIDIPMNLRPSTGFVKEVSENIVPEADDKFFGFDEPEELEEPLISPIKNISLREPRIPPKPHFGLSFGSDVENPKPDIKEVIKKLKATIPKAETAEKSEVFNSDSPSSSDHSIPSSPISKEVETTLSFIKPPRRSYERQRRIRHLSEHEEEEDFSSDDEKENHENIESQQREKDEKREQENVLKPAKKCYQKRNVSKAPKAPHVPKAIKKILKEEEELEKLAAEMNAKFQEIDRCSLVVE